MHLSPAIAGVLTVVLATAAGCGGSPEAVPGNGPVPDAVVARFSGGEIRRLEIREAVERQLAGIPPPVSAEARRDVVRRVVERRARAALLLAEAKARAFDRRPDVRQRMAAAVERLLAADLVAAETASTRAADSLVAEALERRLQGLRPQEARRFSHIFLRAPSTDPAARTAAEARMRAISAELRSGAGFNALAERHSDSVDARGGGRIEWTVRDDLRNEIAEAIFSLQEGGVSPVLATPDGLHLFRLDGVRSGSALDVETLRRTVRQELDGEARTVAARALRQQAVDAAATEFAPASRLVEPAGDRDPWVARWQGGEMLASELRALLPTAAVDAATKAALLRELVGNRLLAARRRQQGLAAALEQQVATTQAATLLDDYRASLVAEVDTVPTDDEIARYHRENRESALFLRDHRLDVLVFPQRGDSVAEAYAAGERVVADLRAGVPFDRVLDRPAREARVCRDAHGVDLEKLGQQSLRLRKAILNLGVGDVTPAVYLDGPRAQLGASDCVIEGRGVAFVRLREVRALPLEAARDTIRRTLEAEKVRAAIDAIQARLMAASKLEILLPEG